MRRTAIPLLGLMVLAACTQLIPIVTQPPPYPQVRAADLKSPGVRALHAAPTGQRGSPVKRPAAVGSRRGPASRLNYCAFARSPTVLASVWTLAPSEEPPMSACSEVASCVRASFRA